MNTLKQNNMMSAYDGFCGATTVRSILNAIPQQLQDSLTGKQLGQVMSAVSASYQAGRASTGAEVIDACPQDGSVFVNCLNRSIEWAGEKLKFAQ